MGNFCEVGCDLQDQKHTALAHERPKLSECSERRVLLVWLKTRIGRLRLWTGHRTECPAQVPGVAGIQGTNIVDPDEMTLGVTLQACYHLNEVIPRQILLCCLVPPMRWDRLSRLFHAIGRLPKLLQDPPVISNHSRHP